MLFMYKDWKNLRNGKACEDRNIMLTLEKHERNIYSKAWRRKDILKTDEPGHDKSPGPG